MNLPIADATATQRQEGKPRRQRGDLVLTGHEMYIDDVVLPGMLHAALVRSRHPHARIVAIDVSAAEAVPGVEFVLTGDQALDLAKPVPHFMDPGLMGGLNTAAFGLLATEKVRWVGEPVVAVVAESLAIAEAAAAAVVVEYDVLPAVFDAEEAMQPDAPLLFEHWPDNVIGRLPNVEGDADSRIRAAAHRGSTTIRIGRHQPAPMETRGYVGSWLTPDHIELWAATQNPHVLRTRLSEVLGVSEERIRVVAPRMGGSFGYKFVGFPEEVLVCVLSRLASAPVKWTETRDDELLAGGREFTHDIEYGFSEDGILEGFKVRMVGNVGCLASWSGWGMTAMGAFTFPGPYRCTDYAVDAIPVVTNKAPWSGFRGYGKEQPAIILERIMDLIAQALGLDPAVVRLRNFQPGEGLPGWVHNKHIDSADYHGALEKVLDLAGYQELRRLQQEARERGELVGIGLGFELTPEGGELFDSLVRGHDSATVRVHPSGTVTVFTGVTSGGTGNDTTVAYLVAREFGIDTETVQTVQGDSDRCPYGFGVMGGRAAMSSASAAVTAAREIRQRMVQFAAQELDCSEEKVLVADGSFVGTDPDRSMTFTDLAGAIYRRGSSGSGIDQSHLEVTKVAGPDNFHHEPDAEGRTNFYASYPFAAALALVAVDAATGIVTVKDYCAIDDCGVLLNPTFVDSQIHGAAAQGVGGVLWEDLPYDDSGHPLAQTLKHYLLPRAADLPTIRVGHQETPTPFTMFGSKSVGDSGVASAMAAVTNAVNDAVAPLGVRLHQLPLTPPRIVSSLRAVRQS